MTQIVKAFASLLLVGCICFYSLAKTEKQTQHEPPFDNSSLVQLEKMHAEFEAPRFYFGGEESRFTWLNLPGLFPHQSIHHNQTFELEVNHRESVNNWLLDIDNSPVTFHQYVENERRIDSVLVLHKGQIVYENYKHHGPLERHAIWSVTKVMVGGAIAILADNGDIDVDRTITDYLPAFSDTAWSDIKIQDVLDMTSGIACQDSMGYGNNDTCVYYMDVASGFLDADSEQKFTVKGQLKSMTASMAPGQLTEYTSSNTSVLGLLIESVTQKPLALALSELLWQPMGAEADGMLVINSLGEANAAGGISARLRDLARFGLLYLKSSDNSPIPPAHLANLYESKRELFSDSMKTNLNRLFDGDNPMHSRWQWDLIWEDGDMYKDGFSGQGLYVSPKNELVLAWFGTADKQFRKHRLLPIARKLSSTNIFQQDSAVLKSQN